MATKENTAPATSPTPGPWRLDGPYQIPIDAAPPNYVEGFMVMNADERFGHSFPVARVIGPAYAGREDECDPELCANAEFIVRACNSHEELLVALALARDTIVGVKMFKRRDSDDYKRLDRVLRLIDKAFAKAYGNAA